MKSKFRSAIFTSFLFIAVNVSGFAQAQKSLPLKITAIKAQLFYDTKGTFSPDVLATPDFAFWNTIIGEGSAEAPSTSTLVTVEISSTNKKGGAGKVELTATNEEGVILLKKVLDVDLVERATFYAPFWLYKTGCEKIKLSARLIGSSSNPVIRKIPFACGE